MKFIAPVFLLVMMGGCSSLMGERSFLSEMNKSDDFFVPGKRFSRVAGDAGKTYRSSTDIEKRTPLSKRERKKYIWRKSLEDELLSKEEALSGPEYQEYLDSMPYLGHISEKIYYLNLPFHERRRYIKGRRIREKRRKKNYKGIAFLKMGELGRNEIRPGMSKKAVLDRWGRPFRVDVAGDPIRQNERWSFNHGGHLREIYFEEGFVQGWRMSAE
ncbi:MAG: hypothetical protein OXB84_07320 [Halobacteriovoraceae bacterium]|nr:hypothetical protein [Halobacteriovoraceae bacterium]